MFFYDATCIFLAIGSRILDPMSLSMATANLVYYLIWWCFYLSHVEARNWLLVSHIVQPREVIMLLDPPNGWLWAHALAEARGLILWSQGGQTNSSMALTARFKGGEKVEGLGKPGHVSDCM